VGGAARRRRGLAADRALAWRPLPCPGLQVRAACFGVRVVQYWATCTVLRATAWLAACLLCGSTAPGGFCVWSHRLSRPVCM